MKNKLSVLLSIVVMGIFLFASFPHVADAAGLRTRGVHNAEGVTCKDCHKVEKPNDAPSHQACLECHGPYEKMAHRTGKLPHNPHDSHLGPIDCKDCHGVHELREPEEIPCMECHAEFKFKMK